MLTQARLDAHGTLNPLIAMTGHLGLTDSAARFKAPSERLISNHHIMRPSFP
jgi:hypothetical protein